MNKKSEFYVVVDVEVRWCIEFLQVACYKLISKTCNMQYKLLFIFLNKELHIFSDKFV